MQQQENSLFDNLLGINLFSQWHCYMIIHIFCWNLVKFSGIFTHSSQICILKKQTKSLFWSFYFVQYFLSYVKRKWNFNWFDAFPGCASLNKVNLLSRIFQCKMGLKWILASCKMYNFVNSKEKKSHATLRTSAGF